MKWHPPDELERLLNQLADELHSEVEEAQLADILRHDPAARRYYRQWLQLHAAIMWEYAAAATSPDEVPKPPVMRKPWSSMVRWALAASVLLVVALSLFRFLQQAGTDPPVAWVEEVQGTVWWTNGKNESLVEPGTTLRVPAGVMVLEGETGSARLRFEDGSTITLNGDAELAFSTEPQKRLVLRRGAMSAQVQPQPPGRAMLVRTTTAEIEVLGTAFAVSLRSNETELDVATGSVQLRRLLDGKTVKVRAQQSVVVSLNATALTPEATGKAPTRWRRTYGQEMQPGTEGQWLPPEGQLTGRVLALPFVAGRRNDKTTIHHGVMFHARPGEPRGFVSLDQESVVRVRYRMKRDNWELICFLSCRNEAGFAGNFEVRYRESHPPADALGWRELRLPLAGTLPIFPKQYPSPNGTQLKALIVHSIEDEVGLEIAEVEITSSVRE